MTIFLLCNNVRADEVKIASGKIDGEYYQIASSICKVIQLKYKHKCTVVLTNGTIENKKLLQENKVNFAILQSFTNQQNSIYKEGVFVLYRDKLDIESVNDLIYYTTYVNINSGDYEAFKFIRNNYNLSLLSKENTKDKYKALCENDIDYYIMAIKLNSKTLQKYLSLCNLKILSFKSKDTINYNGKNIHFANAQVVGYYPGVHIQEILKSNIVQDKI